MFSHDDMLQRCPNPRCESFMLDHCDYHACRWMRCPRCGTYGDPEKERWVLRDRKDS